MLAPSFGYLTVKIPSIQPFQGLNYDPFLMRPSFWPAWKLTTKLLPVVGCWWNRCLTEGLDTLIVWYQKARDTFFAGSRYKRLMKFCCCFRKHTKIRGYARIDEIWILDAGKSDQQVTQAFNIHCSIIMPWLWRQNWHQTSGTVAGDLRPWRPRFETQHRDFQPPCVPSSCKHFGLQ